MGPAMALTPPATWAGAAPKGSRPLQKQPGKRNQIRRAENAGRCLGLWRNLMGYKILILALADCAGRRGHGPHRAPAGGQVENRPRWPAPHRNEDLHCPQAPRSRRLLPVCPEAPSWLPNPLDHFSHIEEASEHGEGQEMVAIRTALRDDPN